MYKWNLKKLKRDAKKLNDIETEKPSEAIRKIYDKRREAHEKGELDEYDILFGKKDVLMKSIIQYLDETSQ